MSFRGLFKHLKPTGTVRFTLSDAFVRSAKPVVLIMQHAGDTNHAFMAAKRKVDAQLGAGTRMPGGKAWVEALIPVFADTVITGWEEVFEEDGAPVPATAAKIIELLSEIASESAEPVAQAMMYAMTEANFRDTPAVNAEALGKK